MRRSSSAGTHRSQQIGARLERHLPQRLRRPFVQTLILGLGIFELRGWSRLLLLQKGAGQDRGHGLVALGVRAWGGSAVYVRPGTTDWNVVHMALFSNYHRPPTGFAPVRSILDLGSNIGVTAADLANQHPEARILAVELDAGNCEVAERNIAPWSDRVSVVHGAAWSSDGEIAYRAGRGEWSYRVISGPEPEPSAEIIDQVPAYSMNTLIEKLAPAGSVDYVKMDIEGAEAEVLRDAESWAPRVRCLKLEVHGKVDLAECESTLQRLGFKTETEPSVPPTVVAIR